MMGSLVVGSVNGEQFPISRNNYVLFGTCLPVGQSRCDVFWLQEFGLCQAVEDFKSITETQFLRLKYIAARLSDRKTVMKSKHDSNEINITVFSLKYIQLLSTSYGSQNGPIACNNLFDKTF